MWRSRGFQCVLTLIFLIVTSQLRSISGIQVLGSLDQWTRDGYDYPLVLGRVNPWSEISALLSAFVVGNLLEFTLPSIPGRDLFAVRVLITVTTVTRGVGCGYNFDQQRTRPQTCEFFRACVCRPGVEKKSARYRRDAKEG
jgi:SSS family solute:Na+ symporter